MPDQNKSEMKTVTGTTLITTLLFFLAGGGLCAWFTNDNDLFHIADIRTDIVLAFILGGIFAALAGGGASFLLEKVTNRHDEP